MTKHTPGPWTVADIPNKLERFRAILENAQRVGLLAQGYHLEHHRHDCRVKIGRKYANVDIGTSGRYMVDLSTEAIYGIKGYGVIHRGHCYGNLDTVEQYDWTGYVATKKDTVGKEK